MMSFEPAGRRAGMPARSHATARAVRRARSAAMVLAALAAALPVVAAADAFTLAPRVTYGQQQYEFDYVDVVVPVTTISSVQRDGFVLSDTIPFEGAGVTLSRGRWFIDVGGQRTRTGETKTAQFIGPFPGFGLPGPGALHDLSVLFKREEVNATVGFGLSSGLTLFVGYKDANTELRNNLSPKLDRVALGNIYLIGQQTNEFSYKGGFVGLSYALPVERFNGAFAFQGSVAQLRGQLTANFDLPVFISVPVAPFLQPIDPRVVGLTTTAPNRGDSVGLNLGISWTGGLGWITPKLSKLSYTIGVDRSEYNFEADDSFNNFSETVTRVRLDLRYAIGIGRDDAE